MTRRRERSKREPNADLALARDTAREEQVRHVRTADHQNESEGEEDGRERQQSFAETFVQRPRSRLERDVRRRIAIDRARMRFARCPCRQPGNRGLARDLWLQPADHAEIDVIVRALRVRTKLAQERERCPIVGCINNEPAKTVRHHADDFILAIVEEQSTADNARIAPECSIPAPVAEDQDWTGSR